MISKLWNKLLDQRWASPPLAVLVLISSVFVTYDFAEAQKNNPEWAGALGLAGPALFCLLVFGAVAELALTLGRAFREPTMHKLKSDLKESNDRFDEMGSVVKQVFDGILYTFGKRLELNQDDQVRLSIYVHDEDRKRFIPCGRYSPNPKFSKPGRTHYPDDEGCIGKGWDHGWHFDNDLPVDKIQRRKYEKDGYRITKSVADNIKMQSRLYAVKRINYGEEALAVIVVESMNHDRFDQVKLQTALDEHNDSLASTVRSLRSFIPNPSSAGDSGL